MTLRASLGLGLLAAALFAGCEGGLTFSDAGAPDALDASAPLDAPSPGDAGPRDAQPIDAYVEPHEGLGVLFIGNSYTFWNDLPAQVAELAPVPIALERSLVGGAQLQLHWENEGRMAIERGGHDVVVLQGNSIEPLTDRDGFDTYADLLADAASASGAEVVFYLTWARRADSDAYTAAWSGGSPEAMQDRLTAAYVAAAERNDARVAPVGEAFRLVLREHAEILLQVDDTSHPTPEGSYLAACVMVETITGAPPSTEPRDDVDDATAALLRDTASRAVDMFD